MDNFNNSRWILGSRAFYDSYSVILNIPKSNYSIAINYTLISPHDVYDPYIKLWALIQNREDPSKSFALQDIFPLKEGRFSNDMFLVRAKENILKASYLKGELKGLKNIISWELRFNSEKSSYLYPSEHLYKLRAVRNKVTTPSLSSYFRGNVSINGESYELSNAKGSQTHHWGNKMPQNFNWGRCIDFDKKDVLFNSYLFKRKLPLNFTSPDIAFFHLYYNSKDYYFNNPINMIFTQNDYHIGYWKFSTENTFLKIKGKYKVDYKNLLSYRVPDIKGIGLFSHFSMNSSLELEIYKREGLIFKKIDKIKSKTASIEFIGRYKDPNVNLILE